MPNLFETVFLIGATSGIGEELARQYHAKGKKVIISGRRIERLDRLKTELVGVETFQMDIQAINSIPHKLGQVFEYFPSINAVIVVAGQQSYYNFNPAQPPLVPGKGAPNTSHINSEITTNFTGPIILTREIIKHALAEPRVAKPFTLACVTSSLAFVPLPIFPVYCASKAALHAFIVSLRAQLLETNVHVVEIIPPYVKTELDTRHQDVLHASFGGKAEPGQDVPEYVQSVIQGIEEVDDDGKPPKIVAEGYPLKMATTWIDAFGPVAKTFGSEL